jgi:hypothetical protein
MVQTSFAEKKQKKKSDQNNMQGFQSGPVPGTFTRLRSCIVPAEITEPPKISGVKQGISHQLGRDAVVRFECENSAIDVIINFL